MTQMKYIQLVYIIDPITDEVVELQIFQLESGDLVGLDWRAMFRDDNMFNPYGILKQGEELEEVESFDEVEP